MGYSFRNQNYRDFLQFISHHHFPTMSIVLRSFKQICEQRFSKIEKQNFKNYIIHKGMWIENNLLAFWLQS